MASFSFFNWILFCILLELLFHCIEQINPCIICHLEKIESYVCHLFTNFILVRSYVFLSLFLVPPLEMLKKLCGAAAAAPTPKAAPAAKKETL